MNIHTSGDMQSVRSHDVANEQDTYESIAREDKELLSQEAVESHWNIRAQRPGVQSVMSARHSLEDNEQATIALQREIATFLGESLHGTILELGVGIGRMTALLAGKATHVTGVDLSPAMLDRASQNLTAFSNIDLNVGRITDLSFKPKSFDLAFESIVLLHILNPEELHATVRKLQEASSKIFLCEHTYEGPDFPISKYSILRTLEEYEELLRPYRLTKSLEHRCAGDRFTLMLFEE